MTAVTRRSATYGTATHPGQGRQRQTFDERPRPPRVEERPTRFEERPRQASQERPRPPRVEERPTRFEERLRPQPRRRRRGAMLLAVVAASSLTITVAACGLALLRHERIARAALSGNAVVAGISTLVGSQEFSSALSGAKASTAKSSTPSPSTAGAPQYPLVLTAKDRQDCPPAAAACVDLSEHITWLQTDGKVSYGPVQMEPGPPGTIHATPTGTFHVSWKAGPNYISNIYNEPIPWAVFFAPGGIAFHEGSLTQGSHGCVHLTMAAAHYYNENLPVGAEVVVF